MFTRAHLTGRGAAYGNLLAAREHLIANTRCTGKVGPAGFCMGTGFCLQLAASGLFDAALRGSTRLATRSNAGMDRTTGNHGEVQRKRKFVIERADFDAADERR